MIYLYIAIGGFIGASLRYFTGEVLSHENMTFPYSTLSVNIIGTYLLAWLTFSGTNWRADIKKAVGTGLLGSFTTFSALSIETVEMVKEGAVVPAILYIVLSVFGGLGAAVAGMKIAEKGRGT